MISQFDKDENVVWSRMVDQDSWEVLIRVDRVFQFRGTLEVWDRTASSRIHTETVPLSMDVFHGKEVPDWESWQKTALDVIDNPEKRHVQKENQSDNRRDSE